MVFVYRAQGGRSSGVERQLPMLYVVGSIPIVRSNFPLRGRRGLLPEAAFLLPERLNIFPFFQNVQPYSSPFFWGNLVLLQKEGKHPIFLRCSKEGGLTLGALKGDF